MKKFLSLVVLVRLILLADFSVASAGLHLQGGGAPLPDNWNFELSLISWEKTGDAFNGQPVSGDSVIAERVINNGTHFSMPLGGDYWRRLAFPVGHKGLHWVGTFERGGRRGTTQGDAPTGTLTSKSFTLNSNFITFLVGGGSDPTNLRIELYERINNTERRPACSDLPGAGGRIVCADGVYVPVEGASKTGLNAELMRRDWWDVRAHRAKTLRIRITDRAAGSWGHINIDDIRFQDTDPRFTPVNSGNLRLPSEVVPFIFRPSQPGQVAATGFVDWDAPVWGASDLHTHPMSHLGIGGRLVYGAPDGDIRIALGSCKAAHGGFGVDNPGGNYIRQIVVNVLDRHYHRRGGTIPDHPPAGFWGGAGADFEHWPTFSSVTHQQMWHEWLRRAQQGGLRVIVALATNSHLLAEVIDGDAPTDDKASADLQIAELRNFVSRHSDFMEIALNPAQLRDIVRRGKLAVVAGIEVDNIGNFNFGNVRSDEAAVRAEIQRLFNSGVRYIFPVHVTDNKFGGAAIYEPLFNLATRFNSVQPLPPAIGSQVPGTSFIVEPAPDPLVTFRLKPHIEEMLKAPPGSGENISAIFRTALDAVESLPVPNPCEPFPVIDLVGRGICCGANQIPSEVCFRHVFPLRHRLAREREYQIAKSYLLTPDPLTESYDRIRPGGHRNAKGITALGRIAINEMMRLGMVIDIDHMSEKMAGEVLEIARDVPGSYPLTSGHNGFRAMAVINPAAARASEQSRTDNQLARLSALGGMMGVGWGYQPETNRSQSPASFLGVLQQRGARPVLTSSNVPYGQLNRCGGSTRSFAQSYLYGLEKGPPIALGTDINGLVATPGPRFGDLASLGGNVCVGQANGVKYSGIPPFPFVGNNEPLAPARTGNKTWDINFDGVAHYGLLPDFFQDLANVGVSSDDMTPLFLSAENFARTWGRALTVSANVR